MYSFTVFFQAFAFVLPQEHVNLFGSFQLCALHVQHLLSSFWTCFYLCLAFEKSLSLVFYITDMISHCQIFSAGFCTLKFHYSLHYPFPFGIFPKGRWFFILQLSDCISENHTFYILLRWPVNFPPNFSYFPFESSTWFFLCSSL